MAFALFVSVFTIAIRDWLIISATGSGLLIVFTGVVIPTENLPFFLGTVGDVLPLTHGVAVFREAFLGSDVMSQGKDLVWELAVGAAYGVGGYLLYRFIEADAKRRGAYETSNL